MALGSVLAPAHQRDLSAPTLAVRAHAVSSPPLPPAAPLMYRRGAHRACYG
eukprot:CAMPEP_0181237410 /NCGR_PEP_ID=MMETSP1096-20121128/38744_1 /TAXON_ID=156174 ORGANISM="Chrysochromulina ericina, Strain CCMP281" /NCGR_SAMPLE_ID=MMETSP1096 /ASSEMBLY_ACC=CAM_ASM_000453 /LENGTH=50 /DNA_ID=CAMNT_0023332755 /DNA_START=220 /DNA_END=372 /DNA_ORIENTATION=-